MYGLGLKLIPTLGRKVYTHYLHWATWGPIGLPLYPNFRLILHFLFRILGNPKPQALEVTDVGEGEAQGIDSVQ